MWCRIKIWSTGLDIHKSCSERVTGGSALNQDVMELWFVYHRSILSMKAIMAEEASKSKLISPTPMC